MVRTTDAGMTVPADPSASPARRATPLNGSAKRDRAAALAAFGPMLETMNERGTGPEGIAANASRQVNDPLGLASEQAMTSPADGAAVPKPAAEPAAKEPGDRGGESSGVRTDADGRDRAPAQKQSSDLNALQARSDARQAGRQTAAESSPGNQNESPNGTADGRSALAGSAAAGARGDGATARGATARGSETTGAVRAVTGAAGGQSAGNAGSGSAGRGEVLPGQAGGEANGTKGLNKSGKAGSFSQILRGEQAEAAPQIAKGLASLLMRKGGSMQIQLRPEALGRVRVDLTMSEGVVSARLEAETEPARQLLTQDIERLRTMLEQRGLRVERLEVTSGQAERDGSATRNGASGFDPGGSEDHAGRDAGEGPGGRDAESGSPWNGGRRARGGDPGGGAERGQTGTESVRAAESGGSGIDAGGGSVWRSAGPVSVRLDAMA